MLNLFLALAAQHPAPVLPDPVAFVRGLLEELDAEAAPMWDRQSQIIAADGNFGRGSIDWSWEDPEIAAGWEKISALLRNHVDPDLARGYSSADFRNFSRIHLMLLLAKPPHPTQRELRIVAESAAPEVRAVAIEILDRAVPEEFRAEQTDWVWLRARDGRWTLAGLELMRNEDGHSAPLCAGARPWQRTDDPAHTLFLRWLPPESPGGERRLFAASHLGALRRSSPTEPSGVDRVALELRQLVAKIDDLKAAGQPQRLHVDAPADLPLTALVPVRWFGEEAGTRSRQILLHVALDHSRRPGVLVFEQTATTPGARILAAGAPLDAFPSGDLTGAPPEPVGIALDPDRTVQDLANTSDALLARGVTTLFLAPPRWDPRDGADPPQQLRVERYWRLSGLMTVGQGQAGGRR